ncbi:Lcl C-terminal domain-containing protein [Paralcaligenes ginsengisoli]
MIRIKQVTRWEFPDDTPIDCLKLVETQPCPIFTGILSMADAPKIGKPWEGQGGVYAGMMRGYDGVPDYPLIVPTHSHAEMSKIAWGSQGKEEPDAASEWDGLANTRALINSNDHPAARWAHNLMIDGHSDFYLPSRRELRLMWMNVPELFGDGCYWSSTQCSPGFAWVQVFGNGGQNVSHEGGPYRARAVRRLIIQ